MRRQMWASLLLLLVVSCGKTPTQVLVVLDAEGIFVIERIAVSVREATPLPDEPPPPPDEVYRIVPSAEDIRSGEHTLPLSFAITPDGGDASRRVLLQVTATTDRGVQIVKRAIFDFVEGEQRAVAIVFEDACGDVTCLARETCVDGACGSAEVATVSPDVARERFSDSGVTPVPPCADADDCADDNVCTLDLCVEGECVYGNMEPQTRCDGRAYGFEIRYCGEEGKCRVRMMSGGSGHICSLSQDVVRCFGDDGLEGSFTTPAGEVGEQITSGDAHACLLSDGQVRCWGDNTFGQLGLGREVPFVAIDEPHVPVEVGRAVLKIAAGRNHTCALSRGGVVRCWGANESGQLGYGTTDNIGDDETPRSDALAIAQEVVDIAAGDAHTCALLADARVLCWGEGANGRLGFGRVDSIGDDESLALAPVVSLGGLDVDALAVGGAHTCALVGRDIRCWGSGANGRLGTGDLLDVGDDETPGTLDAISFTGATAVFAGARSSCAIDVGGGVRCWGEGAAGALGSQSSQDVGDEPGEVGAIGALPLGIVSRIYLGSASERPCAQLSDGDVVCWGTVGSDTVGNEPGDVPVPFAFAERGEHCIHPTNCLSGTCDAGTCD